MISDRIRNLKESGIEDAIGAVGIDSLKWWLRKQPHKFAHEATRSFMEALAEVIPRGKSVLDLGAGVGACVTGLRKLGYDVVGLDGSLGITKLTDGLVRWIDLTGDCTVLHGGADWALFMEVGEHIPPEHERHAIDQVSKIPREGLIVSWAPPDRRGRAHVNCRWPSYVRARFIERGWRYNKTESAHLKKLRQMQFRHPMVFHK